MFRKLTAAALVATGVLGATVASAQTLSGDKFAGVSNWLVRGRAIYIAPNEGNNATGRGLVGGDAIKVESIWAPEVDISYFFTRNFALELVLTYPQKHKVDWANSPLAGGGTLSLGSIKQLPPTLMAQYHLPFANGFKPYAGAGVTYFWITQNDLTVPGVGNVLDIRKSNWGFALQAGLDYALTKNWYLNADVKYIWVETKVTDTAGLGIDAKLKIDPWVLGFGAGYRF